MGVSYQSHQSRCLGTSLPVQCQRIKGAETGWWSDLEGAPRCSTFASPEGPGTRVYWWIAGSKARSVYFQIVALIQVDSLHCWRCLLRMEGRLQFSHLSFDEKHPILLPKCHLAVLLVRFQPVLMKHAGVSTMITALRKCYLIIGVRRIAKPVKITCASCQRQDAAACSQPMAPLPPERVNPAAPFAVTGLDHAGPLYCCDMPRKKFWVLLFTCGVDWGCTSWACGMFIHSGNNSSHTEVICSEGSSWGHLFR